MTKVLPDALGAPVAIAAPDFSPSNLRTPVLSREEIENQRRQAIRAGAIYRQGPGGTTVFRSLGAASYKAWDGQR
jgi:hypothetical protein